ncbi:hypothetical protein [Mucilaginibacter celer]|uniref:Uncharacterized protein n=1 Tax=Mucilaginibacter celer TaxID=2305508 RepID=A0A494VUZ1_9SPHI|nr:hypothetical protein [Mucilaginibacter celer]AYL97300.1 hypothetical protein HYN43_019175 [Mucilaginibacter celer]
MPAKNKLIPIAIVYSALMLSFALFWGSNYSHIVHYKGDEIGYALSFVLILTYIFNIANHLIFKRASIYLTLLSPLIIAIASFLLGFLIMWVGNFFSKSYGTSADIILIYIIIYLLLSLTLLYITLKKRRLILPWQSAPDPKKPA